MAAVLVMVALNRMDLKVLRALRAMEFHQLD
jgi:hypothetical protein